MECYDHMGQDQDKCGYCELISDHEAKIASLTAERDNALSMIRIAYDAGYYQAESGLPNHGDIDRAATEALNKRIGAAEAAAYERAAKIVEPIGMRRPANQYGETMRRFAQDIRALATEPGTTALAEIVKQSVDAETRACAEVMQPMLRSMLSRGEAYRAILARIDQRKEGV